MIQSLLLVFALLLFVGLLIFSRTKIGMRVDGEDVIWLISVLMIIAFGIWNGVHFYRIIDAHFTAEATIEEHIREKEDMQRQLEFLTDELALASVMERAEEYNKELAYGKTAAHSDWNSWSYPAEIYDRLEFVSMPDEPVGE